MGLAITVPDLSDSGGYSGGYGGSCVHLIWQLREPAGLRRRRDWASFSVDEALEIFRAPSVLGGGVRIRRMSTWPRLAGAT